MVGHATLQFESGEYSQILKFATQSFRERQELASAPPNGISHRLNDPKTQADRVPIVRFPRAQIIPSSR